jgi:hypothetical protein
MKKRYWVYVLLGFILAVPTYAKEGNVSDIVTRMKNELHLTDEQAQKIVPIIKEGLLKRQFFADSLKSEITINKANVKSTMRKLKEEENEKLSKVLTEEQMTKLINKQHIKESLNKDDIDFSDALGTPITITPQGGVMQF